MHRGCIVIEDVQCSHLMSIAGCHIAGILLSIAGCHLAGILLSIAGCHFAGILLKSDLNGF